MTTLMNQLTQNLTQGLTKLIGIEPEKGNRTRAMLSSAAPCSARSRVDRTPTMRGMPALSNEMPTLLVVDSSYSMDEKYKGAQCKLVAAKQAARSHVVERGKQCPAAQIGLITFTERAWVVCEPVSLECDKPKLLRAIDSLVTGGGTDMGAAMQCAKDELGGMPGRVVLISDGHGGDPVPASKEIQSDGGIVSCIGIGSDPTEVDEPRLRRAASVLDGVEQYWFVRDLNLLTQTMTMLATSTRQN